ncbi:hypothetical protein D3C85_1674670 [compost metagenome]
MRKCIEAARETGIRIELNEDFLALADRQAGIETANERIAQTGHIAGRHAGADRGDSQLFCSQGLLSHRLRLRIVCGTGTRYVST